MKRNRQLGTLRIGNEGKRASIVHALGKILHDRCRLNMKIFHHFVTTPTAHELNDVAVNTSAHKTHGAAFPERAGGYITMVKA